MIDDNDDDLFFQRRTAERSGYTEQIVAFQRAEEALKYLRAGKPADAVLLDINMPVMDGFEFLEALETDPSSTEDPLVVVMLTNPLNEADRDRIDRVPRVKATVRKPLDQDDLRRIAQMVAASGT